MLPLEARHVEALDGEAGLAQQRVEQREVHRADVVRVEVVGREVPSHAPPDELVGAGPEEVPARVQASDVGRREDQAARGREHTSDLGDDRDVRRQMLGDLAENHEIEGGTRVGQGSRQIDVGSIGIRRARRGGLSGGSPLICSRRRESACPARRSRLWRGPPRSRRAPRRDPAREASDSRAGGAPRGERPRRRASAARRRRARGAPPTAGESPSGRACRAARPPESPRSRRRADSSRGSPRWSGPRAGPSR